MKKIYICSPLSGDYEKNIENAKRYSRYVVLKGLIPVTPHIYFTQFLDDKKPLQPVLLQFHKWVNWLKKLQMKQ